MFQRKLVTAFSMAAMTALNGCLITSPLWNQEFSDHTKAIPIQTWVGTANSQVRIECAKAYHAGLYPDASAQWSFVTNVTSQSTGVLDPRGFLAFGAGKSMVLPAGCWRNDPVNNNWYSALRASLVSDPTKKFKTVDIVGLECVGREDAKATFWWQWDSKGCAKVYSGTNTPIPHVIFRAPA